MADPGLAKSIISRQEGWTSTLPFLLRAGPRLTAQLTAGRRRRRRLFVLLVRRFATDDGEGECGEAGDA
jgi:hypothetical protein